MFIGDDRAWMGEQAAALPECYHATLLPKGMSRGEDMCFAIEHCHSYVITAPWSTFAWWMAFLMRESWLTGARGRLPDEGLEGVIFYNGHDERNPHRSDAHRESFPDVGWVPLRKVEGEMGRWVEEWKE